MGFLARRVAKTKTSVSNAVEWGIFTSVLGMCKDIILTIFMPWKKESRGPAETYEDAMIRMRLSEADINDRKKMFFQQTVIYVVVGLAVIAYGVYLAFQKEILSMILAFTVAALAISYAFRSHFWLFQLKQKKLGCTFKEYLDSSLRE